MTILQNDIIILPLIAKVSDPRAAKMSDYPEHLNPFREDELVSERKKRSGSFSNTLKGFTNTL